MATSNYFIQHAYPQSQNIYEDLVIESIKIMGIDFLYVPRELVKEDQLFGEDIVTKFGNKFLLEMYLESFDGFAGSDVMMNFGLAIKDTAEVSVSKRRFQEEIGINTGLDRPTEGDLLYMPISNTVLEINNVEHENPFYQLGKQYVYKLTAEVFTYSHEEFDTLDKGLDSIDTDKIAESLATSDDSLLEIEGDSVKDFTEASPFGDS